MKNRRFSLTAILILSVLIAAYLVWDYIREESELRVMTLTNDACRISDNDILYLDLTRSWQSLGPTSRSCDTVAIAAEDGDLLMFNGPWDAFDYYRYGLSDGKLLSIEYDTLLPGTTFLNGKLLSVLADHQPGWQQELTIERMRELRVIHTGEESLTEETYTLLERVAGVNKHVGLVFESGDREEFNRIVSMFSPPWMVAPDSLLGTMDDALVMNLKKLELLYLSGTDPASLDRLGDLSGLESLILDYSETSDTVPLHLENLRGLKSLTLVGYDGTTLTGTELPGSLSSLYLVACGSISDVSWLDRYPALRDLSLARCDSLKELSVLEELPALRWLSLSPATSQDSFDEIMNGHPDLEGLELIGCEKLYDLSSLQSLKKLKSLALDLRKIDFGSLKQLQKIKLLVINEKHFSDEEADLENLKAALPNTRIVPGSGFCLGSGWLMLMLPFLLTAILIRVSFDK